jgi:hypothetical protein
MLRREHESIADRQPLSNLIASGQICGGDCVRVDHDDGPVGLLFGREVEGASMGSVGPRGIEAA